MATLLMLFSWLTQRSIDSVYGSPGLRKFIEGYLSFGGVAPWMKAPPFTKSNLLSSAQTRSTVAIPSRACNPFLGSEGLIGQEWVGFRNLHGTCQCIHRIEV